MTSALLNTSDYSNREAPPALQPLTSEVYVHPVTQEHYITLAGLSRMCSVTEQMIRVWCGNHRDISQSKYRKARMLDGSLESVRLFSEVDIANTLSYFNLPKLMNFSILGIRYHLRNLI